MKGRVTILYTVGIVLGLIGNLASFEYDSPGIGKLVFWLSSLLSLPAWIFAELFSSLGDGRSSTVEIVIAVILGFLLTAITDRCIDFFMIGFRRAKGNPGSNPGWK